MVSRHPIRLRGYAGSKTDGRHTIVFSSASMPDGVVNEDWLLNKINKRNDDSCRKQGLTSRLGISGMQAFWRTAPT
jgi:hypothetical protein